MSTLYDGDDAADERHGPVPQPTVDHGAQPGQPEPKPIDVTPQASDDRA
jgi:hypothetical protein